MVETETLQQESHFWITPQENQDLSSTAVLSFQQSTSCLKKRFLEWFLAFPREALHLSTFVVLTEEAGVWELWTSVVGLKAKVQEKSVFERKETFGCSGTKVFGLSTDDGENHYSAKITNIYLPGNDGVNTNVLYRYVK
ncbi:hypothetical protein CEXT_322071 [Caerostris extrusa]|uniref:Uncharacterized protein n=1 Tax=Caerostris extrusa TaxID=172846 RepID=A0AAV4VC22_CAEEX|nr:hypothetical protein CEXT_322071 [Caerostris extrusa]